MSDVLAIIDAEAIAAAGDLRCPVNLSMEIAARIKDRIQLEYGTERPYIPAPSKSARNRGIRDAVRGGEPRDEVAKRFSVHRSTVDRVCSPGQISPGFGSDDWAL